MRFFKYAFVILLGAVACASYAQSSREYAVLGRTAWAAFDCAALASNMKDHAEQERLFRLGYESGKKFLQALESKKIDPKDLREEVPIGFTLVLGGPSADFVLGRVWESAAKDALDDVLMSKGGRNPDDVQKMLAEGKYTKRNCRLLGGGK